MKTLFVVLLLAIYVQSAKFPPNFKKCDRKDPDADKCVLEAAKDGIKQVTKAYPEIGLANFAPLEISELTIGAGSEAVVNVVQKFKNCKLYGIDKLQLDMFKFDFDKKFLSVSGFIPETKKLCDYELDGNILLLPIVGNGASTVILRDIKVSAQFDYEEVQKKNKSYFNFINHKFSLDPDSTYFNFENLFDGDKQLGDNINTVLNENHKEVFADVRKGYEGGLGLIVQQILNNLFKKVSIEEAFD